MIMLAALVVSIIRRVAATTGTAILGLAVLAVAMACGATQITNAGTPSPQITELVPPSETVNGTVVGVIDGRTIDVESNGRIQRVRYVGVDVPDNRAGSQATAFNRFLTEGKTIQLVRDSRESDEYGNLLRYVYVDGELVNESLIINGYARVANTPYEFKYQTRLLTAEESARNERRGIWQTFGSNDTVLPDGTTASSSVPKFGGTLPPLPSTDSQSQQCDFSGTSESLIKGKIDGAGQKAYYLPGNSAYSALRVVTALGDRFFCTEFDAIAAGWTNEDGKP